MAGITLTPEMAQAMDLADDQKGALIEEAVTKGSPAEKAGLQGSDKAFEANGEQVMIGGDIVTAVDGKAVETMQELSAAVRAQKPGDEVELTVLRDGKEIKVTVTLGERTTAQAAPSRRRTGSAEREGAHAAQDGGFRRLAGDQRADAHARDR